MSKRIDYDKPQGPPGFMWVFLGVLLFPFILFTIAAVNQGRMDLDVALGLWGCVLFLMLFRL